MTQNGHGVTKLLLSLIQSIPSMAATDSSQFPCMKPETHHHKSLSSARSIITLSVRYVLLILNSHLYPKHHRWFFPRGFPNKMFVFLFSHMWYRPHPYYTHNLIPPNKTRWTEKIIKILGFKWLPSSYEMVSWHHETILWNGIMTLWNGTMKI
jgi:hypothetical protein